MVLRHRQLHVVVAKIEGELSIAQELLVLPAFVVAVNDHAGIELGNGVDVVVLFFEVLKPTASSVLHAVVDVVPPIDAELEGVSRAQHPRKVDAHHGLVRRVIQCLSGGVDHLLDVESTVESGLQAPEVVERHLPSQRRFLDLVTVAVQGTHVLVELQPHIPQVVWTVVGVSDGF